MEYTIQQKSATFAIEHLAVPIGVRLALYVEVKNWFRVADGLSNHEFSVGATPLVAFSGLLLTSSSIH